MSDFPKNQNHRTFLKEMNNFLKNSDKVDHSRQDLAEKLENREEVNLTSNTMHTWLSIHREEIENHSDYSFESFEKTDGTSGYPTVYWKVNQ